MLPSGRGRTERFYVEIRLVGVEGRDDDYLPAAVAHPPYVGEFVAVRHVALIRASAFVADWDDFHAFDYADAPNALSASVSRHANRLRALREIGGVPALRANFVPQRHELGFQTVVSHLLQIRAPLEFRNRLAVRHPARAVLRTLRQPIRRSVVQLPAGIAVLAGGSPVGLVRDDYFVQALLEILAGEAAPRLWNATRQLPRQDVAVV